MTHDLRRLGHADMEAAARVHRVAFDHALPWLAGLHTPQEDLSFFQDRVFQTCELWGAFRNNQMIGMIAFRSDWVDHLYVLPEAQGCGVGSRLLQIAKDASTGLSLWTFQRNQRARQFYESGGFVLVRETDGAGNEEKEPDALYRWTA